MAHILLKTALKLKKLDRDGADGQASLAALLDPSLILIPGVNELLQKTVALPTAFRLSLISTNRSKLVPRQSSSSFGSEAVTTNRRKRDTS